LLVEKAAMIVLRKRLSTLVKKGHKAWPNTQTSSADGQPHGADDWLHCHTAAAPACANYCCSSLR